MIRELFVEVAESLLEGAMREREARERKKTEAIAQVNADLARRPPMPDLLQLVNLLVETGTRVNWEPIDLTREPYDMQTLMRVRLPCGHVARIWFDEVQMQLAQGPCGVVDYIYEEIEREPTRKCYCVQRENLKPCVPGVCQ